MSLRELQTALARRATGVSPASELEPRIREGGPDASARIAVYEELVLEAHLDALTQTFPVTAAVLGPRYWRGLMRESWDRPGSASADLSRYGEFVPERLALAVKAREELAPLDYLPELATLEWAVHLAISRTVHTRLDWTAFAGLSESEQVQARLVPSPALAKQTFVAPVDEIWRRHQGEPPGVADGEGPHLCCIHPSGRFRVGVLRWDPSQEALLDQLIHGATLASLEALDPSPDITQLHHWIDAGWIVGFASPD